MLMESIVHLLSKDMKISEKIRLIRQQRGFTQDYIAEHIGIDPVNYGRIERGQTNLSVDRLQQICKILNISLAELFSESNWVDFNKAKDQNFTNLLEKNYRYTKRILKRIDELEFKVEKSLNSEGGKISEKE